MKPKYFNELNIIFGEGQPEYEPLPAFKNTSDQGEVVTCWGLSLRERLRILIKGEVWLSQASFNKPINPVFMTTKKTDVLITTKK